MTESEAALYLSALAVLVSIGVAVWKAKTDGDFRDWQKASNDEAAGVQQRFLEIEEARHAREQEEWGNEVAAEEVAAQASFTVDWAWRDSAHTWGRLIARNDGPASAHNVALHVWEEADGGRREVELMSGMDHGQAEGLQVGETVHVAFAFSLAGPREENLRYRLEWEDGAGDGHEDSRQVPIL